MSVNLSIKNVPVELNARLKARAARNHRSLQGELMAILEESINEEDTKLTPRKVLARVRNIGVRTPANSARYIREDRDDRSRR